MRQGHRARERAWGVEGEREGDRRAAWTITKWGAWQASGSRAAPGVPAQLPKCELRAEEQPSHVGWGDSGDQAGLKMAREWVGHLHFLGDAGGFHNPMG